MNYLIAVRTTKRLKIAYAAIIMTVVMWLLLQSGLGQWGILAFLGLVYGLIVWCLDGDLRNEEWVVLPLYGLLVTTTVHALLTNSSLGGPWLLAGAIGYGLVMYGVLLTLNILNVATIRPVPLSRAANTVLSMVGLVCSFGLFYLTLINQPALWSWVISVFGITLLVSWPLLWAGSTTGKLRLQRSLSWSIFSGAALAQVAAVSGFWPVSFMSSLFLAAILFIILGVLHLQEKKQTSQALLRQYLLLTGAVVFIYFIGTQW